MRSRLLMIGLDGFEPSFAERLFDQGRLPTLHRIRESSARATLDHGDARRTGLAWEHVATGLSPADARRWAAVDFDPASYKAWQRPTHLQPFPARLPRSTVVFDAPYFDLAKAPDVQGLVAWGAHDPGVEQVSRPGDLREELEHRFGPYPATDHIYGFVWPCPERTRQMGEALTQAIDVRFAAAQWLFGERLADWDLGLMVVSEFHSAAEALWHGVDPGHPLAGHPSALPAGQALEAIYEETDRQLAILLNRLPECRIVLFNLHGMGANNSDPGSMILLAELMYRHSFGAPHLKPSAFRKGGDGVPLLDEDEGWEDSVAALMPRADAARQLLARLRRRLAPEHDGDDRIPLGWMPGARYEPYWPRMRAFALPSFYDGRIRINLAGRERRGMVPFANYEVICDEIEALLLQCRDARTGKPAVASVERTGGDPRKLMASEADLVVLWGDAPLGLDHPKFGRIGPLPYRRTGGHTGGDGFAWFAGPGIEGMDIGRRSAFDVVPTAIDLLDVRTEGLSGKSFAPKMTDKAAVFSLA